MPGFAVGTLRENCRNTPRLVSYVQSLCALRPDYDAVLRPDDGVSPKLEFYANREDQERHFIRLLESFQEEGFRPRDVVVLSTAAADRSLAGTMENAAWRGRLRPLDSTADGFYRFGTIHAFKGCEAPVIILTDIERIEGRTSRGVFYVGMTRALQRTALLVHEEAFGQLKNAFDRSQDS
jgi:hypothetical protein